MIVSITWSLTQGGGALTPPIAHGNLAPGETGSTVDIYICHNGAEKIYDCGFYLANHETAEIIGWGDNGHGFKMNQNTHDGAASWTVFATGTGDSSGNAVQLNGNSKYDTGDGVDGEIAASAEAHIQVKVEVDDTEAVAGTREFDQVLAYTYTS